MTTFTNAFRLSGISVALLSCALFLFSLACTPSVTNALEELSGGQTSTPCYSNQTVRCPSLPFNPPQTFCFGLCTKTDAIGPICDDEDDTTDINNTLSYTDALSPPAPYQLGRTGKKRSVDEHGNPVDVYCKRTLTCEKRCKLNPLDGKHYCKTPLGPLYGGTPGDKREPYEWSFEYGTWTCSVDNMFPAIDHLVAMIP